MATVGRQMCDVVDSSPCAAEQSKVIQDCVLLIEDNDEAMVLVKNAFQECGEGKYRLEWAADLTGGLQRLARGGVNIIILDLGLPDSTGAASYTAIRKAANGLPVVVLTGDTREQTETAIVSNGVDDYLVKDEISGPLLLQVVRASLYRNRLRGNQ